MQCVCDRRGREKGRRQNERKVRDSESERRKEQEKVYDWGERQR